MTSTNRTLAKIVADSISPHGVRLTTMEIEIPRIVLAEFNTHRQFCLAGDCELEFDLPGGTAKGHRSVYKMRLDEFVDKWLHGARRYAANPKREYPLDWVKPECTYTPMEAAANMGMAHQLNINAACRAGHIIAQRRADGRTWEFTGAALLTWRASKPDHTRFDMRAKLAGMRIRQLNEMTGDIQWSHVVDAVVSGVKPVFEVIAGDFTVAGSADHRVLTVDGWTTIGEIKQGDMLVVRKFGKRDEDKTDPMRLRKIDGVWRSAWQREQRARMLADDPLCRRCRQNTIEDIHHVEPVYQNPGRAFDLDNITALCKPCHDDMHATQDWQSGKYLYGAAVPVEDVVYRGDEPTYDLEIAGDFPNFLANGIVVHNSRNSASSRAIPVEKMLARVADDPYIPEEWTRNGAGMQGHGLIEGEEAEFCEAGWLAARDSAIEHTKYMLELGVHKQTTNRLLEPFMWHTVITTATEWSNFFNLRCHSAAHPAIRNTAEAMRDALVTSEPIRLEFGQWHMPIVDERDAGLRTADKIKLSVARCARVSYLTHDGVRDPQADLDLHDRLLTAGHMAPFEHVGRPANAADVIAAEERRANQAGVLPWMRSEAVAGKLAPSTYFGNFRGWMQYRKTIVGEHDILAHRDGGSQ